MKLDTLRKTIGRALIWDLKGATFQLLMNGADLGAYRYAPSRRRAKVQAISSCLHAVLYDLHTIDRLLDRVFSQFAKHHLEEPNPTFTMNIIFLALDIEMFHVKMLLMLDCIAQAFAYTNPSAFRGKSINALGFSELKNQWKSVNRVQDGLPVAAFTALFDCPWRHELAGVRNSMVHRPSITVPLPKSHRRDRLAFTAHEWPSLRWKRSFSGPTSVYWRKYPKRLFNGHAAYFDCYAGIYLAQLLNYLDDLSPYLLNWMRLPTEVPDPDENVAPFSMIYECLSKTSLQLSK